MDELQATSEGRMKNAIHVLGIFFIFVCCFGATDA